MIDLLNYIVWQPDLEAFHLGPISVRWYGLMWIIGLAMAYLVVRRLYKEQQIKEELFDPLFLYCFLGAEPTIAPSDSAAIRFACSGVEIPNPIAHGISVF